MAGSLMVNRLMVDRLMAGSLMVDRLMVIRLMVNTCVNWLRQPLALLVAGPL